jgi:glycosyltransferase involved in cell wall biosynthesis
MVKKSMLENFYSPNSKRINNRKIKCLFIIDGLLGFAGTEKHLYLVTSNLSRMNFLCQVIAFKASPSMIQEFARKNITVHSLDLERIYGYKAFIKFISLVFQIRRYRPDIVQTLHFMSDTFGVWAARIGGASVVVSSRRDMGYLKDKHHIYLNKLTNPFINNFISVSDRVKRNLLSVEKIPDSKIITIYNGVDLKRYEVGEEAKVRARGKLGLKKNAFILGTTGILRPEKNMHHLLKATAELSSLIENLVLLIVGGGPLKNELLHYSKENGLSDITVFTGYVKDVRDYMGSMDVFCLTSSTEGFSNVNLEGMAMGKPIIATDVGGNVEQVVDGLTGFLVQPGDKDKLVQSIMTLYENPALRESMGIEGRKRAEKYFSIETMSQNMETFYRDLLHSRAK